MALPPGRYPLGSDWLAAQVEKLDAEIARMQLSRDFPVNTCPASRHVQIIAEALAATGTYPMISDDPNHVAGSLVSVVNSLYEARTKLAELGLTWSHDENGNTIWVPRDDNNL